MDILHLIDRLEELFNESRAVPFTHNVIVDEDRMLDIIDEMRIAIPEEVKKAQQVLTQKERILAQAQEEANRTIDLAREKAEELKHEHTITQEAQQLAEQIREDAIADAEKIRRDADEYALESLMRVQGELERLLNQVHNGIRTLEESRRPPAE